MTVEVDPGMSNRRVINPDTGCISFGIVPKIKVRGLVCEEAEIHLFEGRHWGPNRGFGKTHIWAEHQTEMRQMGFGSEDEVGKYVASMVRSGSSLYLPKRRSKTNRRRLLAVRSTAGLAVLEFRHDARLGREIWSIVTAYSRKQTHGIRVGTVR